MRKALIGYTGFVGSNLDRQLDFTHRYNSKNFGELRNEEFDCVYCAGIQAKKWWANENPAQDWLEISALLDVLLTVRTKHFVLISTVDVYKQPKGVDESTAIATEGLHAYGLHRFRVEESMRSLFPSLLVVRLPGLFGEGLKKNLIYDLLADKDISGFDHRSSFQFYDLARVGADTERASSAGLKLVNFAVEPLTVGEVVQKLVGKRYNHETAIGPHSYDMRTKFASKWGKEGDYLLSKDECLSAIAHFQELQNKPKDSGVA